jgi:hypothetical protein
MKTVHAIYELPEQGEALDEITSDKHHEVISISLSSVAVEGNIKHFALAVWVDKDEGEHWHVGSTPGRTFG